jgi:hypothetical protein
MWRRAILSDDGGAAAVEFALVSIVLFFVTFAVIEGSLAAWQFNAVEKSAQTGVRLAVVADPVAASIETFNCGQGTGLASGTSCSDPAALSLPTVTCFGATMSCTDGTFDATAYGAIRDHLRRGYPFVQDANIEIEYANSSLGFAGRPGGAIPVITLRITGVQFNFLVLDVFAQLIPGAADLDGQFIMPDVVASLTGEDLRFKL